MRGSNDQDRAHWVARLRDVIQMLQTLAANSAKPAFKSISSMSGRVTFFARDMLSLNLCRLVEREAGLRKRWCRQMCLPLTPPSPTDATITHHHSPATPNPDPNSGDTDVKQVSVCVDGQCELLSLFGRAFHTFRRQCG